MLALRLFAGALGCAALAGVINGLYVLADGLALLGGFGPWLSLALD